MRNNSRINMICQFIFKVGLPQWGSYTFFNECSLCTLYSSKEIPIAAILLSAATHYSVSSLVQKQTKRSGGSKKQSHRFKGA